ncbi:MAG TPA: hypothetical protein VLV55_10990, partial [Rhizomicrobium sp.]|nr:hypothetical protein [Rhizomicrobium sp.]
MTGWDRREILIAGGAAAALAAAPAMAASRAVRHIVVADARFAASRAFAETAAKSGARIVWTEGDITDFWRDELDLLWR